MLMTTARVAYLTRASDASRKLSPIAQKKIRNLYWAGALMFIFAFVIWNLDNVFCDALSGWKIVLGWPAAFLLEGTFYVRGTGYAKTHHCLPLRSCLVARLYGEFLKLTQRRPRVSTFSNLSQAAGTYYMINGTTCERLSPPP